MNFRAITKNIGLALLVDAGFMFLSVIVSALYGFDSAFSPLLISGMLTLLVGILPILFVKKQDRITTREGFFILFFAWLLSRLHICARLPVLLPQLAHRRCGTAVPSCSARRPAPYGPSTSRNRTGSDVA